MNETLRKGKFSGLLYREFYLARKTFVTAVIMFAVFAVTGWLVFLSLRYGNLAMLFESEVPVERKESVRDTVFAMMKGLPALMGMQFIFMAAGVTGDDEKLAAWRRFARCSPVTPVRRAAVRIAFLALSAAASFLLPAAYIAFIDAVQGKGVSFDEAAVLLTCVVGITAATVLAQIYITLLHSMDKGMLALMGTILVPTWIYAFISGMDRHDEEIELEEALLPFCRSFCPFAPLVFIAVLAAGFAVLCLLYKRREK